MSVLRNMCAILQILVFANSLFVVESIIVRTSKRTFCSFDAIASKMASIWGLLVVVAYGIQAYIFPSTPR